jgi:recombination protein RecA
LEAKLADRAPSAFTLKTRQAPELFPSGVAELDALLGGGIPRGGITEITGSSSTGKTTLALSLLARLTAKGGVCAWVDVQDALDPETAAAHGVCLERLLWLRVTGAAMEAPLAAISFGGRREAQRPNGSPHPAPAHHPRNEMRAMGSAVSQLFQNGNEASRHNKIGTPRVPNQILSFHATGPRCAEPQPHPRKLVQVPTDRLPPRRGETVLESQAKRQRKELAVERQSNVFPHTRFRSATPRPRLDEALRATDLLLQAGGFGAIVLDMSDVRPELSARIPIAFWHRFRLAVEQAQVALILLTQAPCAKSCASLVLRCCANEREPWRQGAETALFTTLRYRVTIERKRHEEIHPLEKKPVARAAEWRARTPWAR